ncbi:unnamed protein product [Arabidopsis halleri]
MFLKYIFWSLTTPGWILDWRRRPLCCCKYSCLRQT